MGRNDSKRAGQSALERSGVKSKVIQCNQIRLFCITFYMCMCLLVFILLNLPPSSAPMRHCSHENGTRKPDADVDTGGSRCDRSEGTSLDRRRRQGTPLCCSARTWSINPECDSGIPLLAANFYPESHSGLPLARLRTEHYFHAIAMRIARRAILFFLPCLLLHDNPRSRSSSCLGFITKYGITSCGLSHVTSARICR